MKNETCTNCDEPITAHASWCGIGAEKPSYEQERDAAAEAHIEENLYWHPKPAFKAGADWANERMGKAKQWDIDWGLARIKELTRELGKLKDKEVVYAQLDAECTRLQFERDDIRAHNKTLQGNLDDVANLESELRGQLNTTLAHIETLKRLFEKESDKLASENQQAKRDYDFLMSEHRLAQADVEKLRADIKSLGIESNNTVKVCWEERKAMKAERDELRARLEKTTQVLDMVGPNVNKLCEERDAALAVCERFSAAYKELIMIGADYSPLDEALAEYEKLKNV